MQSTWLLKLVFGMSVIAATPLLRAQEEKNQERGSRAPLAGGPPRFNYLNSEFATISYVPVQKELNLTDDQKSKVDELCSAFRATTRPDFSGEGGRDREVMLQKIEEASKRAEKFTREKTPELHALLSEQQKTRLSQIIVQHQGRLIFTLPQYQEQLGLTAEQRDRMAAIHEEHSLRSREALTAARQDGADEAALYKTGLDLIDAWTQACEEVLTPAQKEKLAAMRGKDFDLSQLQSRSSRGL
jgi:Spy/CpxP family protein refolding chaperone